MMTRSSRHRRAAVALALAAGLIAASCGGNDPDAVATTAPAVTTAAPDTTAAPEPGTDTTVAVETTAPDTTVAPEPQPVAGGSITVGLIGESTGFNPTVDAWADSGHVVAHAIFDSLAAYDASGKPVPYLAESITPNADSTAWTIVLRPGITFHNGEPLNAEAVQANFQAILDSAQFKDQLALVSTMTAVDDLTLEVAMSAPWGTFMNVLTGETGAQAGYMAAPAMLADPNGGRNPIGTGPFVFQEWVPDSQLTVARNDSYWQTPAWLDSVTFTPIPDSTSRKAAFDAGDIQLYTTGSTKDIGEYLAQQEAGTTNVTLGSASSPDMVLFNTAVAPLDDVRVRRALAMAIDVNRLYEYLEGVGVKEAMHGPYADDSFWFAESNYPDFDPEGAKALIDEYVAEKGAVEFEFAGNQDPFLVSYQELFQAMWADIGVSANIVSRAQSENISAVLSGAHQVILWGGIGGGDPDKDYQYFHSGTGLNFSGYTSPTIDAAMEQGRALGDPEARKEQYAIVQQELGEQMPYIFTGTNRLSAIAAGNLLGIDAFTLPDGTPGQPVTGAIYHLKDVWLAQ